MVKRLKSGLFAHGDSQAKDPRLEIIRRDVGRLTDKKSNARAVAAEERLKLKSFKEGDYDPAKG